jgi:hypothetical protein
MLDMHVWGTWTGAAGGMSGAQQINAADVERLITVPF